MIETNHTTFQLMELEHKDIQRAEHTQAGPVPQSHTYKTQLSNPENTPQKITNHFTTKLRSTKEKPKIRNPTRPTEQRNTMSQRVQSKIQATTRNPDRVSNHMGRQTHSHRGHNLQSLLPKHQGATSPKDLIRPHV